MLEKNDVETQLNRAIDYYRFRSTQNFDTRKLCITAWVILLVAAVGTEKLGISGIKAMYLLVVLTVIFWMIDLIQGSGLMRWDEFIRSLENLVSNNKFDVDPSKIYFSSYYDKKKINDAFIFIKSSKTTQILYLSQLLIICIVFICHLYRGDG